MAEKQETIVDIIAEKRRRAEAIKRDCAKMREALESVNKIYDLLSKLCIVIEEVRQACREARVVLIAPPRNCDVGTAEEQAERYMNFCHNYPKCTGCPCVGLIQYGQCEFAWAQLPYEKGGAK